MPILSQWSTIRTAVCLLNSFLVNSAECRIILLGHINKRQGAQLVLKHVSEILFHRLNNVYSIMVKQTFLLLLNSL